MKKVLAGMVVSMVLVGLLSGCSSQANAEASKSSNKSGKKYIIATDATYAPFEFQKDNKYVGIDLDILDSIAKLEGFQYELSPMDFKGIIPALQSNQIDGAIAGINITDDRKKILDFSDGYYESGLSAVIKKGNDKVKSLNDLNNKIFAVKKGTAGAKYAEDNKEKLSAEIKYFNDTPSMFQEVKNGNADVTFEDYPVIAYMISVDPNSGLAVAGDKITKTDYGFAVKKDSNKELLDMFNDGFKKIKTNGEYDKIISKYIKK
ncbi:transporter substrate-binding domain-containing protein [Clostridium sp. YIM B02515]|uniref:Transporter substrate-binding domain-containing protein n=1 Tax=Clostridium rhizosphaerae TaxID=2803861 RepID=A0ABS1TCZ6_9CLOT|nr:transporter substrate-binding domain-containing protein [Clostridium rhizosphaerae]MBL4937136.1 transporter substrate-binding domain-containing protein [Clostridium rhizosphaerae]